MSQKRITNQILEQTNYTLNSTLNYLFNISNMKKLFSYLLISSMVVLSSCTNYDDQFDDLNTQINTLKSQIEGFSSLSSGLTALQGTVASLQTAIANIKVTPATDVSGLATAANLTALDTALTALATEVAAIKTALAGAATSAEVATLQANLTTAQADLASLLAQNNVYAPVGGVLNVKSQADLDFATALGNKVTIINGGVDIDQTTTMSATDLASLMGKFMSVTGTVTYTATVSSTTPGEFTKLNGAANVSVSVAAPAAISMPALKQTGNLSITAALASSVSLPALTKAATLGTLSFPKAASFSMPVMVEHDNAITITIDDEGSVDLSAFKNDTTGITMTAETNTTADKLTITAGTLTAPVYAMGEIDADDLTAVSLPKWTYTDGSSFARAKTVVLPSVTPVAKAAGVTIAINSVFPKATSVHFIAAASTGTTDATKVNTTVTSSSANLETLILGGVYASVTISSGSDLSSLTFDGTAADVTITGTDIKDLNIPYTAVAEGSLLVKNNSKLESITASKVNGIKTLTITGNTDLTAMSFAALKTAGAKAPSVTINNNDLTIENVQIPSATVAHVIESVDFTPLAAYITAAVTNIDTLKSGTVSITADNVLKVTAADGTANNNPTVGAAATKSVSTGSADVGNNVIADYSYLASNGVPGKAAQKSFIITDLGNGAGSTTVKINGSNVSLLPDTGLDDLYDVQAWAGAAGTAAQLSTAGYTVAVGSAENTADLTINAYGVTGVLTFDAGPGKAVSIVANVPSTVQEIATALVGAINLADGVLSKHYSVTSSTSGAASVLGFTMLEKGSAKAAFALDITSYNLSGAVASTTATKGFTTGTAGSIVEGANVADTDSAWLTFTAKDGGVAKAYTVSISGNSVVVTSLNASGVDTGAGATGDDEAGDVTATDTTTQTNSAAIAAVSINYASKLK